MSQTYERIVKIILKCILTCLLTDHVLRLRMSSLVDMNESIQRTINLYLSFGQVLKPRSSHTCIMEVFRFRWAPPLSYFGKHTIRSKEILRFQSHICSW